MINKVFKKRYSLYSKTFQFFFLALSTSCQSKLSRILKWIQWSASMTNCSVKLVIKAKWHQWSLWISTAFCVNKQPLGFHLFSMPQIFETTKTFIITRKFRSHTGTSHLRRGSCYAFLPNFFSFLFWSDRNVFNLISDQFKYYMTTCLYYFKFFYLCRASIEMLCTSGMTRLKYP